ncbi:hypothetical protein FisN_8Hu413 [Fistulifera solaris]|uniref:Uncharacterized protein n=1 Tax=Fistulifera solaris TaxID=1519565 RepID=A0A1Z5JND4_FISSO|nr:hypothetical protein FisN_8Hu413 [Fistulifera solaris]|eukprot:GAX15291.1 hypothetical protein FisN_8Hu413 [Fistulifera solaris]
MFQRYERTCDVYGCTWTRTLEVDEAFGWISRTHGCSFEASNSERPKGVRLGGFELRDEQGNETKRDWLRRHDWWMLVLSIEQTAAVCYTFEHRGRVLRSVHVCYGYQVPTNAI